MRQYFTDVPFLIEYSFNIEEVPDAVLAVPFVCCVLPVIWITDSELIIPELDQDFYNAIPEFKNGYINMYPETAFLGQLQVQQLVSTTPEAPARSAALFSGGLDATTTTLIHIDEKPILVALWGADIPYDDVAGWDRKNQLLGQQAKNYGLPYETVRTTFRIFDRELVLSAQYSNQLGKGWWYGVKHGIAILSHAAPLAWHYGIKKLYFASSNCPQDGSLVRCASDPRIDNFVRFCGCQVYHDGFELNRQDKAAFVVNYKREHPDTRIGLHVCWETTTGENCCRCEKCYRTMVNLWAEGEDPREYGFAYPDNVFWNMKKVVALRHKGLAKNSWTYAKNRLNENWPAIRKKDYARKIKWIRKFDFHHADDNWMVKLYLFAKQVKHLGRK